VVSELFFIYSVIKAQLGTVYYNLRIVSDIFLFLNYDSGIADQIKRKNLQMPSLATVNKYPSAGPRSVLYSC
jgi:hypothetical protein